MIVIKQILNTIKNTIFSLITIVLNIFIILLILLKSIMKYVEMSVGGILGSYLFLQIIQLLIYGKGLMKVISSFAVIFVVFLLCILLKDNDYEMESFIEDVNQLVVNLLSDVKYDIYDKDKIYRTVNFPFWISKYILYICIFACKCMILTIFAPIVYIALNIRKYIGLLNFTYKIPCILSILVIILSILAIVSLILIVIDFYYEIDDNANYICDFYKIAKANNKENIRTKEKIHKIRKRRFLLRRKQKFEVSNDYADMEILYKLEKTKNELNSMLNKCKKIQYNISKFDLSEEDETTRANLKSRLDTITEQIKKYIGIKYSDVKKMYDKIQEDYIIIYKFYQDYLQFSDKIDEKYSNSNIEENIRKAFLKCKTKEELKKQYRKLCKKYHPDNCKNEEIIKIVNNIYEKFKEMY